MKLHGDIISPFVRMCLVTGHEAGIGDKLELVVTKVSPTAANEQLAALSPIAKVPVLLTDHGHAVHDSRVIIEYLCHVSGNKTLIPDDGVKRFRVLDAGSNRPGHGRCSGELSLRNRRNALRVLQWQPWMDRLKLRVDAALDELEKTWEKDLAEVTAGSIAVAVTLSYIDYRLGNWEWRKQRPGLAAFHERFSARPSMQKTPLPPP